MTSSLVRVWTWLKCQFLWRGKLFRTAWVEDLPDDLAPSTVNVVALIRRRARRMGFRQDELPDVQQQIVLAMRAFRYDPARANGASEKTALTSLVDRQLSTLRRAKVRRERLVAPVESDHEEIVEPGDCGRSECATALVIDVREVVGRLPAKDRRICEALSMGQSIDEIARNLECSWHTVKHRVEGLREYFEHVELDGWIRG